MIKLFFVCFRKQVQIYECIIKMICLSFRWVNMVAYVVFSSCSGVDFCLCIGDMANSGVEKKMQRSKI